MDDQLCLKCQQPATLQLACSHFLCNDCWPQSPSPHLQNIVYFCELCSSMNIIETNPDPIQINLEHMLICWECQKGPLNMEQFLEGNHRNHSVMTIKKAISQVNNHLTHESESISLENQALYRKVDTLSRQKRNLTEQYIIDSNSIKMAFQELITTIKEEEEKVLKKYDEYVLDQCSIIDSQICQWKQSIRKCENYMKTIDHKSKNITPIEALESVHFYVEFRQGLRKFIEELCINRIQNKPLNLKQYTINFQKTIQLNKQLAKLNKIFTYEDTQPPQIIEEVKEDESQNYFQQKKRQIFAQNSFSTSVTSITQKKQKSPELSLRSFNIDERLSNLRKMMNLPKNTERQSKYS